MTNKSKHNITKIILKILGIMILIAGLACMIIGVTNFFKSANTHESPRLFYFTFIGMPLMFVGSVMLSFAFKREVTRYIKNESVPVINEATKELKPSFNVIADSFKTDTNNTYICNKCGAKNPTDSNFCNNCGTQLKIKCPKCGDINPNNSNFCNNCGESLKKE